MDAKLQTACVCNKTTARQHTCAKILRHMFRDTVHWNSGPKKFGFGFRGRMLWRDAGAPRPPIRSATRSASFWAFCVRLSSSFRFVRRSCAAGTMWSARRFWCVWARSCWRVPVSASSVRAGATMASASSPSIGTSKASLWRAAATMAPRKGCTLEPIARVCL